MIWAPAAPKIPNFLLNHKVCKISALNHKVWLPPVFFFPGIYLEFFKKFQVLRSGKCRSTWNFLKHLGIRWSNLTRNARNSKGNRCKTTNMIKNFRLRRAKQARRYQNNWFWNWSQKNSRYSDPENAGVPGIFWAPGNSLVKFDPECSKFKGKSV